MAGMGIILVLLALPAAVVGVAVLKQPGGVMQEIVGALFLLIAAVLVGSAAVADRVVWANKKLVHELQDLRRLLLRVEAERMARGLTTPESTPAADASEA